MEKKFTKLVGTKVRVSEHLHKMVSSSGNSYVGCAAIVLITLQQNAMLPKMMSSLKTFKLKGLLQLKGNNG